MLKLKNCLLKVDKCFQICTLELVGDRQLYVGTGEGLLLEYSLPNVRESARSGSVNLVNAKELGPVRMEFSFWKIKKSIS